MPPGATRTLLALSALAVASSCGDGGTPNDAGLSAARRASAPTCASPDEAPLRGPDGALACTRLGALGEAPRGAWPDVTSAAAPIVYVRAGATGDGSRDAPRGDLASALAQTPAPATVVLAQGTYRLAQTLEIARALALVGSGAGRTVLEAPAGTPALRLRAGGSATVRDLTVRAAPSEGGSLLEAEGRGASLALRGVSLEGGGDGALVRDGATLCAVSATARAQGRRGVVATSGAGLFLRDVVVRGASSAGVLVDRAHLHVERALVAACGRDGLVIRGAQRGAACAVDADCAAPSPCAGFDYAVRCVADFGPRAARRCRSVDVVTDVASLGNAVTAMRASRSPPTTAERDAGQADAVLTWAGPLVLGARLVLAGTRALAGAPGGDGLYVGPTATVALDPEVSSDAARGRASEVVANARVGVLVDGDHASGTVPHALRQGGRVVIAGARVTSNEGPGLYVQERGLIERLGFSELDDNGALGLGVTSGGGVALMVCNRFVRTRPGTVVAEDTSVRPFELGDGASLAQGVDNGGRTRVVDSEFSENARFGLVFDGYDATLDDGAQGGNRGAGNAYGLALYGGARVDGSTPPGAIRGRIAVAPPSAPTARGPLAAAGP